MPFPEPAPNPPAAETDVYAIQEAEPEVLAYAMAKYSRSALSMRESLAEISAQRAEQFLNTFYFQYGHRSIADLAHMPFAIERLSMLAAIELVDEQRWDGQERSTRYQNFLTSGWTTPELGGETAAFTASIQAMFAAYAAINTRMLDALKAAIPQPETMKFEAWERTLKARAFDVARYLLPLATNTSLGQIVNARTLETQISRLLSSPYAEVQQLGEKLKQASTAPTLVKYASTNEYLIQSRRELAQAAAELMKSREVFAAPVVDLLDDAEPIEVELATSLLYPHCHYSYRQIRGHIAALTEHERLEIIDLGTRHRGPHDELLRPFSAGEGFRFDILMDIGGFRDMHRHRRCVQLRQEYTDAHGYEEPVCPGQPTLAQAGIEAEYNTAMDAAHKAYRNLRDAGHTDAAAYTLPLGTRCRAMFKMDFAEALYIAELRSGVGGHFSYRRVAWEMYRAIADRHPGLAKHFRIKDVNEPVDLLRR